MDMQEWPSRDEPKTMGKVEVVVMGVAGVCLGVLMVAGTIWLVSKMFGWL